MMALVRKMEFGNNQDNQDYSIPKGPVVIDQLSKC